MSNEDPSTSHSLETPAELASRVGVPVASVRYLIKTRQLDHIYLTPGKRNPKIPLGSWERYVRSHTVKANSTDHSTRNGGSA